MVLSSTSIGSPKSVIWLSEPFSLLPPLLEDLFNISLGLISAIGSPTIAISWLVFGVAPLFFVGGLAGESAFVVDSGFVSLLLSVEGLALVNLIAFFSPPFSTGTFISSLDFFSEADF